MFPRRRIAAAAAALLVWAGPARAQRAARAPIAVRAVAVLNFVVPLLGASPQPSLASALQQRPALIQPAAALAPSLPPGIAVTIPARSAAGSLAAEPRSAAIAAPSLEQTPSRLNSPRRDTEADSILAADLAALPSGLPGRASIALRAPEAARPSGALEGARALGRTLARDADAGGQVLSRAFDAAATLPAGRAWVPGNPALAPRQAQDSPSGPAAPAVERSGRQLLESAGRMAAAGHAPRDYDSARRYMFSTADNVEIDGVRGVVDAYSGVFIPGAGGDGTRYRERGDSNGDGFVDSHGMNAEHVWPQSFFEGKLPMRADLHHLLPTLMHPNSIRGHLPFGVVPDHAEYSNSGGARMGGGVFEPPDAAKGRVARATLYFAARYGDRAIRRGDFSPRRWNSLVETLLDWNRRFPPDARERRRNDLVERFQGNRNPFVDDPSLADRIGEGWRIAAVETQGRYARDAGLQFEPRHRHGRHRHKHHKRRR